MVSVRLTAAGPGRLVLVRRRVLPAPSEASDSAYKNMRPSCAGIVLFVALVSVRQAHAVASAAAAAASPQFAPTAELPDLLTMIDGRRVETQGQWRQRREELKTLLQEHIVGTLPLQLPVLESVMMINSTNGTDGINSCYLRLAFMANKTGVDFDIELAWPAEAAAGPLPLFLTQWNHRSWGLQGVQRGYMMVLYPGADTRDASAGFRAACKSPVLTPSVISKTFVTVCLCGQTLGHRCGRSSPGRSLRPAL